MVRWLSWCERKSGPMAGLVLWPGGLIGGPALYTESFIGIKNNFKIKDLSMPYMIVICFRKEYKMPIFLVGKTLTK